MYFTALDGFEVIKEISVILIAGFVGGYIALKLKQPVIIGYILAGAIIALPFFSKYLKIENSASLAQIGASLLLFAIGVEFSLDKLIKVKNVVVFGAIFQIILTVLLGWIVLRWFNLTSFEAFSLAGVFSLSSTAVAIKILEQRKETETRAGEIMLGWLVLQDIAVVFLVILLQGVGAKDSFDIGIVSVAILKSLVLIVVAVVIGRKLIPLILKPIAKTGSKELLLVLSLIFPLLLAYLTERIGLSYTLGAFLAGVMVSESFLNHEIFSEIKPLRNVFSLLFFISVGSLFSFSFLFQNLLKIVLLGTVVIALKTIIVLVLTVFFSNQHPKLAFKIAFGLQHIGEFAFLISAILLANGLIREDVNSLVISVTVLSLILAPFLYNSADNFYEKLREFVQKRNPQLHRTLFMRGQEFEVDQPEFNKHIIVCGYGRVGSYVGEALMKLKIHFIAIDFDSEKVERLRAEGVNIIYGDASQREILDKADIERAKAIVLALPEENDVNMISKMVKEINPKMKVLARAHNIKAKEALISIGVDETIEPEFEAALSLVHKIMQFLGENDKKVLYWLRNVKEMNDLNETSEE